jgi:hypothetical protein
MFISLNSLNQLIFVMVKCDVLFEVQTEFLNVIYINFGLGGLVVSLLAIALQIRGFKPDRRRWIVKGDKNQQLNFLRRRSKPIATMS